MTTIITTRDAGFPPTRMLAEGKINELLARAGALATLASGRICIDEDKRKKRRHDANSLMQNAIALAWDWPGLEFPTMRRIEKIKGVLNR